MEAEEEQLFVAQGKPSELDVLFMAEELGHGTVRTPQADLTMPFRQPSHISIGLPLTSALESTSAMPTSMRSQFDIYEFHQVQLACSFHAAPGCHFTDARFMVKLTTVMESPDQGPTGVEEAIAYDLFPQTLEDARMVTVKTAIKAEVSFGYEPASAILTLPSREHVDEQIRYTSRIEAFDLQGSQPAWSFRRTQQHEIGGPQRLFMLVRKPRGSAVMATFDLRARVQFVVGGKGFSPVDLIMMFRTRDRSEVLTDAPTLALC